MKKSLIYFSAISLMIGATTILTSCDDNFERPPMVVPVATIEANTTIEELKNEFFQAGVNNYATLVGTKKDGSHYIIEGYVSTSDESGNYFKQIVIQDETSAIQLDVDAYDLYLSYQLGQKIVLDVTGLYIGAYGRLVQIGTVPTSGYPARISENDFANHAQRDGLANVETLVQPEIFSLADLKNTTPDSQTGLDWQNRLIKIEGVTFQNAGKQTLSTSGSNGVSQTFSNSEGSAILYTSGYSDFWDYYCPTGTGDIVGILSCYNATWQIRLIDIEGLQGFDELVKAPTGGSDDPNPNPGDGTGNGTKDNPYSVAAVQGGATGSDVWVKGYIVGWVDGMTLADGAKFNASATVQSNILIADTKTANTVAAVIPVQLPAGDARNALNLQTHPENLGKEVLLQGSLEKYFGTEGLKSVSAYEIDGAPAGDEGPTEPVASLSQDFEGGSIPAGWTQVNVSGNKSWYVTSYQGNYYAAMTGYQGTAPFDQYLVTPAIDMDNAEVKTLTFDTEVNGYGSKTSKFEVYVITDPTDPTSNATQLTVTLPTAPASGYSDWKSSGTVDLSDFTGTIYIAFRYSATVDSNYATWCLDNVKVNVK